MGVLKYGVARCSLLIQSYMYYANHNIIVEGTHLLAGGVNEWPWLILQCWKL